MTHTWWTTRASWTSDFFDRIFGRVPVMAILRGMDAERTVGLCHRAWDLGIEVVEVPVQTHEALPSLRAAVAAGRERGRTVGAGTVVTVEQVGEVLSAGAGFTVAPGLDEDVARASTDAGMPHLPGVSTASEITRALRTTGPWIKAFPASWLTPDWIRAQRAPFPQARFVATGGVDAHNAGALLDAGCRVVAVGSALADPGQLDLLGDLIRDRYPETGERPGPTEEKPRDTGGGPT